MNRSKIDDRNAKAHLVESYNELSQQFSTYTPVQQIGNYRILGQIGEGAFGKVFLAVHTLLHVKVVLKQGKKDDPNVVREVYYQKMLKHPNIPKLYEVIVTDSHVYMCIEWCCEGELYDYLMKYKTMPILKLKKLFSQLCGSVYYLHQKNTCHRDLKLENILLDKKKHIKLSDFGFARELPGCKDSNTLLPQQNSFLETICGTTVYMAPELIDRKPYLGQQADMWSLGVILYTLLYGYMPFDEDDDVKTAYKILNQEPVYKQEIPNDLIELIKWLLKKTPQDRPSSLLYVLQHPFLEPFGLKQIKIVDTLISKPSKPFQSKLEKILLKKLARLHFDTKLLIDNVTEKKADNLCGIWELMLEKERKAEIQKRKKLSRSRSVLRLSQAISSNTAKSISRKNSFNASTLALVLSNNSKLEKPEIQANSQFDSYSQTLNDVSVTSPSKSTQSTSTTQVNNSRASHSPPSPEPLKRFKTISSSISNNKKRNILQKLTKFLSTHKSNKNEDLEARQEMNVPSTVSSTHSVEQPMDSTTTMEEAIAPESSLLEESIVDPRHQTMKRSASSNSGGIRPASMISTYSSYSQLTTMSETSAGSEYNTSFSTDVAGHPLQRPQYYRAKSSDMSVYSRYSTRGEPISSNSSATNISRSTSIESSRSNSMKTRGRSRQDGLVQQKKNNNNFFMKRGKSPLGQTNRFVIKRKVGLLNSRKPRASVIQEEYETSLTNSTSNLSLNDTAVDLPRELENSRASEMEPLAPTYEEVHGETVQGDLERHQDPTD